MVKKAIFVMLLIWTTQLCTEGASQAEPKTTKPTYNLQENLGSKTKDKSIDEGSGKHKEESEGTQKNVTEGIMTILIFVATLTSVLSAAVAWHQAKKSTLVKLFSDFRSANEAILANPRVIYSVHDICEETFPVEEAANVAYFSLLLDGFDNYYQQKYHGNFAKMADELTSPEKSNFLNRILSLEENQQRWELIRNRYYGDADKPFIDAIDDIIKHERNKKDY